MSSRHRRDRFDDACFGFRLTAGEEAEVPGKHAVRALGALGDKEHDQAPPDPGEPPSHVGAELAEPSAGEQGAEELPAKETGVVLRDQDSVVGHVDAEKDLADDGLASDGPHALVQTGVRSEQRRHQGRDLQSMQSFVSNSGHGKSSRGESVLQEMSVTLQ